MPRIPFYEAQRSNQVGLPSPRPNYGAFGAPGRAAQELGNTIQRVGNQVGGVLLERQQREQRQEASLDVIEARGDIAKEAVRWQQEAEPGLPGYAEHMGTYVSDYTDRILEGVEDPEARDYVRRQMAGINSQWQVTATTQSAASTATLKQNKAAGAVNAAINTVLAFPEQYDGLVEETGNFLDSLGLAGDDRVALEQDVADKLARARFSGMLDRASTPEAVAAVGAELDDEQWREVISPTDYQRLRNSVSSRQSELRRMATAEARTLMDSYSERIDAGKPIARGDLDMVDAVVSRTGDPGLVQRWQRTRAEYEGKRIGFTQPAGVSQASIDILNAAGSRPTTGRYTFRGVDARRQEGVDRLPPAMKDRLNAAANIFGADLPISSGFRSEGEQAAIRARSGNSIRVAKDSYHSAGEAVDISTAGMSAQQKAKLTAAMVQVGFTGVGEYDGHMHFDMRDRTPKTLFRNGTNWGGWTELSPEVADVMRAAGFNANLPATRIARGGPGATSTGLAGAIRTAASHSRNGVSATFLTVMAQKESSFGKNTVAATSSARGSFQFIEGTWLDMVATYGDRYGIDTGASRGELLALRDDDQLSAFMAMHYAEENKAVLEDAFPSREISDGDLYLAHFLGPMQAAMFIGEMERDPDLLAADLLPQQAKANRPIFYGQGGKIRSLEEVYQRLTDDFTGGNVELATVTSSAIEAGRKRQLDMARKDQVSFVSDAGIAQVGEIDFVSGEVMDERAQKRAQVTAYMEWGAEGIRVKTFIEEELVQIKDLLTGDDFDRKTAALRNIAAMGPVAEDAFAQIGETDQFAAHVGGLATRNFPAAREAMRGDNALQDKGFKDALFEDSGARFLDVVGSSLDQLRMRDPAAVAAVQRSADAIYAASHSYGDAFDPSAYEDAVEKALGARLHEVNGGSVVLPDGVSPEEFDGALESLRQEDLVRLSVSGLPPKDRFGTVVRARDVAERSRFVNGPREGLFFVHGEDDLPFITDDGRRYAMELDKDVVAALADRPARFELAPSTPDPTDMEPADPGMSEGERRARGRAAFIRERQTLLKASGEAAHERAAGGDPEPPPNAPPEPERRSRRRVRGGGRD